MRKITNEELGRPSAGEFARMEKMPVAVVLDNVRSMQNVGAFFRTADAFAVDRKSTRLNSSHTLASRMPSSA